MIKRANKDIQNLQKIANNTIVDNSNGNIIIKTKIKGPIDSIYQNGEWELRIELPKEYPYKSPSVGFSTKIYHPNVDYNSGSICLNVLNQTWTPIYNLCHIYNTFIPQLLLYPNPEDPLNTEASKLYIENRDEFNNKVTNSINSINSMT